MTSCGVMACGPGKKVIKSNENETVIKEDHFDEDIILINWPKSLKSLKYYI